MPRSVTDHQGAVGAAAEAVNGGMPLPPIRLRAEALGPDTQHQPTPSRLRLILSRRFMHHPRQYPTSRVRMLPERTLRDRSTFENRMTSLKRSGPQPL
jgi:hypothetical protein